MYDGVWGLTVVIFLPALAGKYLNADSKLDNYLLVAWKVVVALT